MTTRSSLPLLLVVVACGGADVTIGNDDSGSGDTGSLTDAATDGSNPTDSTPPNDSSPLPDAQAFDPLTISGLVLWLDASSGITKNGAAVSAWADKTTNKNDAKEPTAALQPTFVTSAINNLPAVHFDKDAQGSSVGGNMMTIADATSLQFGTGDFYIVVATRFDNTVADGAERGVGILWAKPVANGGNSFPGVFVSCNIAGGLTNGPAQNGMAFATSFASGNFVTSSSTFNDDTPHQVAVQRVGALIDLRVDGVSLGTSNSSTVDVSAAGVAISIGGEANGQGVRLDGDIAEMLAVKGTLSTSDRGSLEQYLKSKYAL